jgi:hypothetical protein
MTKEKIPKNIPKNIKELKDWDGCELNTTGAAMVTGFKIAYIRAAIYREQLQAFHPLGSTDYIIKKEDLIYWYENRVGRGRPAKITNK